jgi:hypothetical protein
MELKFWYAIFATLLAINVSVSIFLFKRDDLEPFQKVSQIVFVWLIPLIGAIVTWRVNKSHDVSYKRNKELGGGASSLGSYDSAGSGGGDGGGGSD